MEGTADAHLHAAFGHAAAAWEHAQNNQPQLALMHWVKQKEHDARADRLRAAEQRSATLSRTAAQSSQQQMGVTPLAASDDYVADIEERVEQALRGEMRRARRAVGQKRLVPARPAREELGEELRQLGCEMPVERAMRALGRNRGEGIGLREALIAELPAPRSSVRSSGGAKGGAGSGKAIEEVRSCFPSAIGEATKSA